MKTMVSDLKPGEAVDSLFSVKYKRAPVAYKNGWRFAFGASDRTGEVEVSYWGGSDEARVAALHDSFSEGDVVRVKGFAGVWKERLKIDVNEGRGSVEKTAEFELSDFLPTTLKNVDAMRQELAAVIASVGHEGLRLLLQSIFNDAELGPRFSKWPASMYLHHAYVGGLLEHTLAVTTLARAAAGQYAGEVDADLVTAGALLHDIGKLRELEMTTNIKITEEGMLRGHTVIGEEITREHARKTGLDEITLGKLSHVILSHHGKNEHGAPKEPQFAEAAIVHYCDALEAKTRQFLRIKQETNTEDFRVYDKNVGEVYLR